MSSNLTASARIMKNTDWGNSIGVFFAVSFFLGCDCFSRRNPAFVNGVNTTYLNSLSMQLNDAAQ
ncbi:MAG: hypothetical protein Q4G54_01015 [Pelistega sp.]|nr:hypothetical protein [Pelistega sp.]